MKVSLDYVIKRAKKAKKAVIVGAGERGRELLKQLLINNVASVDAFFDNDEELTNKSINSIKVIKPQKLKDEDCVYIIAVDAGASRSALRSQLLGYGIPGEEIIAYYYNRDYDYLSKLDEKFYKAEVDEIYFEKFGRRIDWKNPLTYTEIINWEKLNVKDKRKTTLTDKYTVREWIKRKIGEKYLTKLYGVWDEADDIDFQSLPNSFALKINNGSGRNIIVKNKREINFDHARQQLNEWKEINFAYMSMELHYKDIVPKIICEEYLEGLAESVYDYNIYCFHGEPEYIHCIKASHRPGWCGSFYNKNWEVQSFSYGCPRDSILAPRPEKLEEMLELSRVLSKEFSHVRVDWYNLPDGRVLFGEMTFSAWSGLTRFCPEEYDMIFGNLIKKGKSM